MPADQTLMEKLVALCKRRGFIFPSSEIYGGIGGFWDYGPLGVELKQNIKEAWWHDMVTCPPAGPDGREVTMVGLDSAIIMNPKVWEASGHAGNFADPMVDCKQCRSRFRADQLWIGCFGNRTFGDTLSSAVGRQQRIHAVGREQGFEDLERAWASSFEINPDFEKTVVAASREEAGRLSELTQKEKKALGVVSWGPPVPFAKYMARQNRLASPPCPNCGERALTEARLFNLMFRTHYGALEDEASLTYLRPETAQGIFVNFRNVLDTARVKIPFGIAQMGKAFRNEINPRNFTFRSREFEQMEIEFFCKGTQARRHEGTQGSVGVPPASGSAGVSPAITDMDWYQFWRKVRFDWYVKLGLKSEKLRLRDQTDKELAHYSRACADIEYLFPFSDEFQELEGVAHRGCFDLTQHQQHSGKDLSYFDDDGWQSFMRARKELGLPELSKEEKARESERFRFLPTVIEPSAGADRAALAFLCEAYSEDEAPDEKGRLEKRVVMRFHPRLAPIKAAFFPLVSRERMPDLAYAMYRDAKRHFNVFFDDGGSIGRRYRRQDEAGTPFCITVDGQTLTDGTVTIRDRDTLKQERVHKDHVIGWLKQRLSAE